MRQKLNYLFIAGHIVTLLYIFLLGWWSLVLLPVSLLLFALGQGAFAHRIFTHKAMDISPRAHWIGHFIFNMCGWGSALVFGSIHKMHHRYSGTENDPHEPRYQGKWNVFLGNYNLCTDKKFFKREYKKPHAAWFHKNYFKLAWLFIPIFGPLTAISFWLRYLLLVVVHDGEEDGDTARNKWWLWPLLLGDEMHYEHHRSATRAKLHNLDMVYYSGCLLKLIP